MLPIPRLDWSLSSPRQDPVKTPWRRDQDLLKNLISNPGPFPDAYNPILEIPALWFTVLHRTPGESEQMFRRSLKS